MKRLPITTTDQVTLLAEVYGDNNPVALVINPAIGVPKKLCQTFPRFMASAGVSWALYHSRVTADRLLAAFKTARDLGHIDKRMVGPTSRGFSSTEPFGIF